MFFNRKYLENKIKEINVDVDLFHSNLEECYQSICMPLPTHSLSLKQF